MTHAKPLTAELPSSSKLGLHGAQVLVLAAIPVSDGQVELLQPRSSEPPPPSRGHAGRVVSDCGKS